MYTTLAPMSSHVVAFAKQYREEELRVAERLRVTSSLVKLRVTAWLTSAPIAAGADAV